MNFMKLGFLIFFIAGAFLSGYRFYRGVNSNSFVDLFNKDILTIEKDPIRFSIALSIYKWGVIIWGIGLVVTVAVFSIYGWG